MNLSKVSISVSGAYVLVVAGIATIAMLVSWGLFAANLLTLPAGTLVLGVFYFLVIPVLDLAYGISGPLALTVMVLGYVVAAMVNVVLVLGLVTLCRELRDSRARTRAASAST